MKNQISTIFLTGATGVLGAQLLRQILETTKCDVYCLVRGEDLQNGRERLRHFLKVYDTEFSLESEFNKRVTPILGDIRHPQLGLNSEEYLALQQHVDLTIHAAANTNLLAKYKNIKPINVGGAQEIINFCLGTKSKALSYISTYTVVGSRGFDNTLVFRESDLDVGQTFKYMSYQESKFEAEKLVREAQNLGLVWKIFRPGQIFGESTTGNYPHSQTQVSGLFYDLIKTAIETEMACRSDNYDFDIVPVDYVAKAIVTLSLKRDIPFETYHLTNPDRQSFSTVIKEVSKMGYPIRLIDVDDFRALIRQNWTSATPYDSPAMRAFKWWFLLAEFSFQENSVIDTEFTASILKEYGLTCPKLDVNLLRVYIDQGVGTGLIPKAKSVSENQVEHALNA